MADSKMKDLQRGSIIKTVNGANKTENWALVLGCMEDRDTVTCLRLVTDEEFKNIPSLKVTTDIFGEDVNAYANPFSFLNIKLDWVVEVKDPIQQIEFFSVVSSVVNYFAGFFYRDNGELKMDIPYVQNPVFFMINGMVTINQAHKIELTSKIKMQERKEKKEQAAVERKLSNIHPFGKKKFGQKTPQPKDLAKTFENLGVYTLDTQNRIEAIYKFFLNYLAPGERLSIPMVYKIMFKEAQLQRMQLSNSSVTKEEFAFIINSDITEVADKLTISKTAAGVIRNQAIAIFNGSDEKVGTTDNSMYEFARILYNDGKKKSEIVDAVVQKFDVSTIKATRITNYMIPKQSSKTSNDQISKILDVSSYGWVSALKDFDEIFKHITYYSDKSIKIHDGTVTVDTGDLFNDAIILIAIYQSINTWKWFDFVFEDRYRKVVNFFASLTINDMLKRYTPKKIQYQTFYSSKLMLVKILSDFICMSDEDKLYLKAVDSGAVPRNPERVSPIYRAYVSASVNSLSKNVSHAIGSIIGIENADNIYDITRDGKFGYSKVANSDLMSTVLITGKASRELAKKK